MVLSVWPCRTPTCTSAALCANPNRHTLPQACLGLLRLPVQAVLRLLAHAYTVYLMHLTSGGRIAAAAVQKLQLPAIDALAFYR